jgi:hypothetical protein
MKKIREAFKEHFDDFGIELPEKIEKKGTISQGGWSITYVLTTDEQGDPCLDFVAEHRMTTMQHVRIRQNGEVDTVDTIQDNYTYNAEIEGDQERAEEEMKEHNKRFTDQLSEKGLL